MQHDVAEDEDLARTACPIGIQLKAPAEKVVVVSVYLAGDKACPPSDHIWWHLVAARISRWSSSAMLSVWGSSATNRMGEYLLDFIRNWTDIYNKSTQEELDLTLVSRSLKLHITGWNVPPEESDHTTILFGIGFNTNSLSPTRNPMKFTAT